MDSFYDKYIEKENAYYRTLSVGKPTDGVLTPMSINNAVDWLCENSTSILDFGCGSGGMLFCCAFRSVKELVGIDLAEAGIVHAVKCAEYLPESHFRFSCGSIDKLRTFPNGRFDGIILSNILDNMRPADSIEALAEAVRTLKKGGKALIKLNSVISPEQINEWNMQEIGEDLLDDGLLLWNKDDIHWMKLFNNFFTDIQKEDVYFEEYDMHNRLFLCVK